MNLSRYAHLLSLLLLTLALTSAAQAAAPAPLTPLSTQDHARLVRAAVENAEGLRKALMEANASEDRKPRAADVLRAVRRLPKVQPEVRKRADDAALQMSDYERFARSLPEAERAVIDGIVARVRSAGDVPEQAKLLGALKDEHAERPALQMGLTVAAELLGTNRFVVEHTPKGKEIGGEIVAGALMGALWGVARGEGAGITRAAVNARDGAVNGALAQALVVVAAP
jgi:hypothetical protein